MNTVAAREVLAGLLHCIPIQKLQESCKYMNFIRYAELLQALHLETVGFFIKWAKVQSEFLVCDGRCVEFAVSRYQWRAHSAIVEPGLQTVVTLSHPGSLQSEQGHHRVLYDNGEIRDREVPSLES